MIVLHNDNILLIYFTLDLTSCEDLSCVKKKSCVLDVDGPRCVVCDFQCYDWRSKVGPICATNGHTYNNWCELREHICNISVYIEIEGLGICGGKGLNI